jgi:hypothetical protein
MAKDLTATQYSEAHGLMRLVGENIRACKVGGKVLIEIDPDVDLGPSQTGKQILKSNSGGQVHWDGILPAGVKVALLQVRKNPDYKPPPK